MSTDALSIELDDAEHGIPEADAELPTEILDQAQAETWLMWLHAARSRVSEIDAEAERHHDRIEAWREARSHSDRGRITALTQLLEEHARRERERGRKSYIGPYGGWETRDVGDEWVWDTERLLAEAKQQHPEAVATVEHVDKRMVKAVIGRRGDELLWPSGARVESVQVVPRPVTVRVKVAE